MGPFECHVCARNKTYVNPLKAEGTSSTSCFNQEITFCVRVFLVILIVKLIISVNNISQLMKLKSSVPLLYYEVPGSNPDFLSPRSRSHRQLLLHSIIKFV